MPFFVKIPVQPWYFNMYIVNLFGRPVPFISNTVGIENELQVLCSVGHVCFGNPGVAIVEVDRLEVGM